MNVVVVESPAKAKTINKYLGSDYKVLASFGHVRDLPAKDGSVNPDDGFAMSWEVKTDANKRLKDISAALKNAKTLFLATDPDREGEAISWHVMDVLEKKKMLKGKDVKRVVFNAITKKSVLEAMANPRDIDMPLVDAYLARRALDYLVGFNLSPILWRKLPGARSAGRVQSVALRLVCDREIEIERFIKDEYWQIVAELKTPRNDKFSARLTSFDDEKLKKLSIKNNESADLIRQMLEQASFKIEEIEAKPTRRNPSPPFTTSTLQQAASSKLGFSAQRTMQVAQKLYEGIDIGGETTGLITYMRTDGVQIAPEAVDEARLEIKSRFGDRYCPSKARHYETKAKNSQEAHEAIRPTGFARSPDQVKTYLNDDQLKLYTLIWKKAIASQMASAEIEQTAVDIVATGSGKSATLRANGSVIRFNGFLTVYTEQKDEDQKDETDEKTGKSEDTKLPLIHQGEDALREKINATQHFTEPPPRYSEASLIKKMEELGIGRPSTYASTLATLSTREYVKLEKRKLFPEAKGRLVTAFLGSFFDRYIEFDFTASLEDKLDHISAGKINWKDVLRDFWNEFQSHVEGTKELRVTNVLDALNEELSEFAFPDRNDGTNPRICPTCGEGNLSLKLSRYGAFVGCSNYPECKFTRQLSKDNQVETEASLSNEPQELGKDPNTDEPVTLRSGRFGPYVQRGEGKEAKRTSLPKGWAPDSIDYERAMALISLPRNIGAHPETGKMISSGLGRYGPFLLHDGAYANVESIEDVFSIGLNRAVTLIAEKANSNSTRKSAITLNELGEHPDGGKIAVLDGRYGPYVKWGKINATLPRGSDPKTITLDQGVELVNIKAAGGKKKKAPVRKKTTRKKTG